MSEPLITIALPCYNAADTIERALRSALAQDWKNLEILVADDCSTDGSVAIVARLAAIHPAIRLVRRAENGGPGATRQTLVEEAQGTFLCFFDDDDESLPQRVRRQHETIVEYEQAGGQTLVACYASGRRIYPNGYVKPLPAIGSRPVIPHGAGVAAYILFFRKEAGWFYGSGTASCALMARKETLLAAGGFDPALRRAEDMDFAVRLALAGGHFIGCADELFIQYATVAPDKSYEKNRDAAIRLAEKHGAWLATVGMRDYARRWPLVRYYHFRRRYARMAGVLLGLALRHPVKTARHLGVSGWRRFWHERRMA